MDRPLPGRHMNRCVALLVGLMVVLWLANATRGPRMHACQADDSPGSALAVQRRRPIALALSTDRKWLYVANARSGTITVCDVSKADRSSATVSGASGSLPPLAIAAEVSVAEHLADLHALSDGRLLALDDRAHQLLLIEVNGPELSVRARLPVSPFPVRVRPAPDGQKAIVTSLWSRHVNVVALQPEGLRVERTIALDFNPREQVFLTPDRVLIADAFGGEMAIVDPITGEILSQRRLSGHNLHGLAVDQKGQHVLVAHQIVNNLAETSHNDIHWGIVLFNVVRWLPIQNLLDPERDLLQGSHLLPTGDFNGAGGDPAALTHLHDGRVAVCLSGTNRLAYGGAGDDALRSVPTEHRPIALIADPAAPRLFVANHLSDSITEVSWDKGVSTGQTSLGPRPDETSLDRGERLFYDATLALDGWFSCHSCHTDGHTTEELVDTLDDGHSGAARRVLSLLGTGTTGPWGWAGNIATLEEHVEKSVTVTMQGNGLEGQQIDDLAAYLRSLTLPPPGSDSDTIVGNASKEKGSKLFESKGCSACHTPGHGYTSGSVYDVGVSDRLGQTLFNPPSLRGVGQRRTLLHDASVSSLEELLTSRRHGQGRPTESAESELGDLAPEELRDLIQFLRGL